MSSSKNNTIRKKKGFFTFVFSLWPGCGEMYLGFYKQGLSLLGGSMLLCAVSMFADVGVLMFALPVMWFYSFCHVHNMVALSDEEFYALEDNYIFNVSDDSVKGFLQTAKAKTITGVALVVIGICALWNAIESFLYNMIPSEFMDQYISPFFDDIPRFVIGVIVVALGVMLIKGKKKELDALEDHSANEAQ